jgi:hypothetical protein
MTTTPKPTDEEKIAMKWHDIGYEKAKLKIRREILQEIDERLFSNKEEIRDLKSKKIEGLHNSYGMGMLEGEIEAFQNIREFIKDSYPIDGLIQEPTDDK